MDVWDAGAIQVAHASVSVDGVVPSLSEARDSVVLRARLPPRNVARNPSWSWRLYEDCVPIGLK